MPFQPLPRPLSVLAGALAAGLMLTVTSCGHVTPLGPAPPKPHHLRSPIILHATRILLTSPAGRCPAGSVALAGGPSQCYRMIGAPLTITSAAVAVSSLQPDNPSGQPTGPSSYGFMIALPVSDAPALTTLTTVAFDAHGSLALTVAGHTWALPTVMQPFTRPQFEIIPSSRSEAQLLKRALDPPA